MESNLDADYRNLRKRVNGTKLLSEAKLAAMRY